MKYFALLALLGAAQAVHLSQHAAPGSPSAYLPRAAAGEQAKPQEPFKVPENHEAEPALHDSVTPNVRPAGPAAAAPAKAASLAQLGEPCEEALDVSPHQLAVQLDYLSRRLDIKYYNNAMKIYGELKKNGQDPKVSVHTWELYDKAFSFDRVRRYELVQHHMDLLQHFEDNLNQNFTNMQHVTTFLEVAKAAQKALNEKYHNGEFSDPAGYDPEEEHPVTWATANV